MNGIGRCGTGGVPQQLYDVVAVADELIIDEFDRARPGRVDVQGFDVQNFGWRIGFGGLVSRRDPGRRGQFSRPQKRFAHNLT